MIVISPEDLRPGMILGKDLLGEHNQLLLSMGQILSEKSIRRIGGMGYTSIFIAGKPPEERTEGVGVSAWLRESAMRTTKRIFQQLEDDGGVSNRPIDEARELVDEMIQEILSVKSATLSMTDLQLFDDYTYQHSVNVTIISLILGTVMGLSHEDLRKLGLGAILHDIGKIFVPKDLLNKQSRLTMEEFETIKQHSLRGYEYLSVQKEISHESCLAALSHHEKYDGTGYPMGVGGAKIHIMGRIVAVADVYDALTSDRPYRKALPPAEAMEYILGNCGTHFDPEIVEMFFQRIALYPIGTRVVLSNGLEGIVVENRPREGMRPKVRIISDQVEPIYYDLGADMSLLNVTIKEIRYKG